jgi:small subunit ribosomal protein S26
MRSLRRFLIEDFQEKNRILKLTATKADEEADYQRSLAINEAWNNEIAKVRDARVARWRANHEKIVLDIIDKKQAEEKVMKEKIEKTVLKEIEASKSYITRDNVDQAIEHALANPVSFNFAIDLDGNKYQSGKLITKDENVGQESQS